MNKRGWEKKNERADERDKMKNSENELEYITEWMGGGGTKWEQIRL